MDHNGAVTAANCSQTRLYGYTQESVAPVPAARHNRVASGDAILTGEMHGLPLLQFVAVAMLILVNAFFVAAEFAMVSVRDTRIEQMLAAGVPGARAVRRLQHELDDFLPAVQLGVTLCSLALGWIGEPLAASMFLGWLQLLPSIPAYALVYAHLAAVALSFAVITYFQVLVGELVPKSLALRTGRGAGGGGGAAHAVCSWQWRGRRCASCGTRPRWFCGDSMCRMTERVGGAFARRVEADCDCCAADGYSAQVPGDHCSSRAGTGRCADSRDHDAAAEDFLAALEHAD